MSDVIEYPFHKAAKTSLIIAGVLCCILVFAAPIGIWIIYKVTRARVTISPTGVKVNGLFSSGFEFADVERLGLLKIPIAARGAGGALAQAKLGGLPYGLNLVAKLKNGKNVKFITNQHERHEEMIEKIKANVNVPCEEIPMGIFGWKWPEQKRAA